MKQQPVNDPFLDPSLGPELWTRVRPDRANYWPFVLLLAIGLTGFSFYWRTQILPQQPLVWQSSTEFQWRPMLQDREPTLIWVAATLDGPAAEVAGQVPLTLAIAALDTPELRRATRLKSARLWKFETPLPSELLQALRTTWSPEADAMADHGGLILWQPDERRQRFLSTDEIQPSVVEQWLLVTRADDVP